ncbi:hypothetical protein ACFP56_07910 [Paenibacillus septentrionalis]|uniref:DUF3221 domain-containing protein n=1 Tax=Paenibacillus septentrionalis TaxID=429342 RepID=A0ABW1V256_9BACL
MKQLPVFLVLLAVLLIAGCGNSVNSFQGQIENIQENGFLIGCSEAANKGKKGGINDIGYMCNVQYNDETIFRDVDSNSLHVDDILTGSMANVILEKPVDIRKKIEKNDSFVLIAKEIVLLEK